IIGVLLSFYYILQKSHSYYNFIVSAQRQQARASFLENESKYGVWQMAGAMYTKKRFEYGVFQEVSARYPKKS
uniref:hypothetical protein n=1 Tax=Senimuribacter intestinalis TaxID=2941507 RepID=UPI0020425847